MDFDAVANELIEISIPYVERRLHEEHERSKSDPKVKKQIEGAFNYLKTSKEVPWWARWGIRLLSLLPMPSLSRRYVRQQAERDGSFLASSWLQFLAYALDENAKLQLGDDTLPLAGSYDNSILKAWRECTNQMIIKDTDIKEILSNFVRRNMADDQLGLPFRTVIKRTQNGYIAEKGNHGNA